MKYSISALFVWAGIALIKNAKNPDKLRTYLPMVICFIVFFVTDAYGFVNWSIMNKRQKAGEEKDLSEAGFFARSGKRL